jgi:hypothetical protein
VLVSGGVVLQEKILTTNNPSRIPYELIQLALPDRRRRPGVTPAVNPVAVQLQLSALGEVISVGVTNSLP